MTMSYIDDKNILLDCDSYKSSHFLQYPPKMTSMMSYIESRGGMHSQMIFFGLQYYLKKYLSQRITQFMVDEARDFFSQHGVPFNHEGWSYIAGELNGYLPLRIRALPEGTVTPSYVPMVTIESTDPKAFWVVSWVETMLLRIWYPITVASISFSIKETLRRYLEKSSDDPTLELSNKLHDFGSRGVSSRESAAIGSAAHLLNFQTTDTIPGVVLLNNYYDAQMAGTSIPASEHATMTAWGKERELDAYKNMLRTFGKDGGTFACVSDSYDIYNACSNIWGEALRTEIQDLGANVIIRLDSGDPALVAADCLRRLDYKFGSRTNSKGYRVLNNVRIIQGDGINERSIKSILDLTLTCGYSATNISFGMGGALLQQLNRDTNKFAMKCCSATIDEKEVDVFKDPVTDKEKSSKSGRLDTILSDGKLSTIKLEGGAAYDERTALRTVFLNGNVTVDQNLNEIRSRSNGSG